MPDDFFHELAQLDVPAAPSDFDRALHQRLNRALVVLHLVDLAFRGLPWALVHFMQAVGGAMRYSLSGRPDDSVGKKDQ